jgi:hypothetical protein
MTEEEEEDDDDYDSCGAIGRMNSRESNYLEKTCLSAVYGPQILQIAWPGLEPGPPRWEAGYYRLSYGMLIQ